MPTSRRDFLLGGATALLSISGAKLAASPARPNPPAAEKLREAWQSQRQGIRTLRVVFETVLDGQEGWSEEARWLQVGNTEFRFEAPNRTWFVAQREGLKLTEYQDSNRFFQGMESPDASRQPYISYDGPPRQGKKASLSLEFFAPGLDDKPTFDLGRAVVHQQPTLIVGQGDRRLYVAPSEPFLVRRLEQYRTESQLAKRTEYLDHDILDGRLPFPRAMTILEWNEQGAQRAPVRIAVAEVQLNQPLPPLVSTWDRQIHG
jgi:hypothetical protein